MARPYFGRIQRDENGKRLYGRAHRYNREDLRVIPIAVLTSDVASGDAPLTVQFDDSDSQEPGTARAPATYSYNFGDGSAVVVGRDPEHTFDDPGTYTVTLTVTDGLSFSTSDTLIVEVTAP